MSLSQQRRHIVVVGGGIFGITAAIELKKRHYSVTVIDPEPLPNERASSTDISKLIRADYGSDEFYMELMVYCSEPLSIYLVYFFKYQIQKSTYHWVIQEECFRIWREWNKEWGEELYHEDGILAIGRGWKVCFFAQRRATTSYQSISVNISLHVSFEERRMCLTTMSRRVASLQTISTT
jgi:glycine/D-amino acid oxidase-like deaminating enzyme